MRKTYARRIKGHKQRECLACEHMFKSAGIHNRICDTCKHEQAGMDLNTLNMVSMHYRKSYMRPVSEWRYQTASY